MTGSNKLSEDIIEGLIGMIKAIGQNDAITIDQHITTVKFAKLILFNWTFYLGDYDKKESVFIHFAKSLIDYLKRIVVKIAEHLENSNTIILYNLVLNLL
jgi:hypothetical protein